MSSCSACSSQVPEEARFCASCGAAVGASATPTRLDRGSDAEVRPDGRSGNGGGRFVPGSVLGGRYRIIGLLGRGGMGEVYRADDLRLGQPVALKFLPVSLGRDPGRLARFHSEVRLARQVAHPNVCRMYDIGETEGQHFLSMEYVDGEDLESLLRRIGRLPGDKAIQFARQLCAGLAAAHDAGVLHRDLKPANVMIDGRGRARIADFGLAAVSGGVSGPEARSGTPDYMSPEQLSGRDVTVRSDLYALGLILYETFTGKRPFDRSVTPAEAANIRERSTLRTPSSVHEGIDPAVERAILRCLEKDPQRRPASAMAVAAALPGGDPLAMALAAGETPSPEMVAAAGEEGALPAPIAWACLLGIVLGLSGAIFLGAPVSLVSRLPMDKPPEVLADRARDIVRKLGHDAPARDSAYSFDVESEYSRYVQEHDRSPRRWDALSSGRAPTLFFWYRQSPDLLVPGESLSVVRPNDPPRTLPGMATVRLDTRGRLTGFDAVPVAEVAPTDPTPDWSVLFSEADLPMTGFHPTPPTRLPPVFCDHRMAWEGSIPEMPGVPIHIEAGAYGGRIVNFAITGPWTPASASQASSKTIGEIFERNLQIALLIAATVAGIVLARRNLRLGRGDRSGALKIALYFVAIHVLVWALWVHHVPDLAYEWQIFSMDTGWTLFNAALIWLFYLSLEPYVRRRWPGTLISWSRVLAGRFLDPLVGRDILFGGVLGAFIFLIIQLSRRMPSWIGLPPAIPEPGNPANLLNVRWALGEALDANVHGLLTVMQVLFLVLLFCALLRKEWIGLGAFILIFTVAVSVGNESFWVTAPLAAVAVSAFVLGIRRYGILSGAVAALWVQLINRVGFTADLGSWYAAPTIMAVAVVVGLALYGFRLALAGRPAFRLLAEEAG